MTTPPASIVLVIEPSQVPEQVRKDLHANATLNRQTDEQRLAEILAKKLGHVFTVRPYTNASAA